jgi:hypothetical protein
MANEVYCQLYRVDYNGRSSHFIIKPFTCLCHIASLTLSRIDWGSKIAFCSNFSLAA